MPLRYTNEPDAEGRRTVVCECGYTRHTHWPIERIHHACPHANTPCRHRGEELRIENCPTCAGNVRIKVFACAVHGECTLVKPLPSIACCQSCRDYSPSSAAVSSGPSSSTISAAASWPSGGG